MCLSDLYDFTPEQRIAIARLEHLRAMRSYVQGVRNAIRADLSMPANAGNASLCAEPAAAGAAFSMETIA
ncbi:hypothetical protein FHW84_001787 [Dyella sp. SG562]|uniref:hypothetical protein n=1 Tax=Dyella sp. SG562 TaxID=2587017 RepID=UPI00141EDB84|nr:hypothetical protein [Dyella sp. SG562]NII73218.1 hypothetical protein [Dyella sp. SG562]